MAARKTTPKKSTKSAPKGKRAAQPPQEDLGPILSRPVWGVIWGIVGLLCLLSILPIDGVLLKWLHRGIGALIGKGAYVMPSASPSCCLRVPRVRCVCAERVSRSCRC